MAEDKAKKRFATILADPPWDIDQRGNYGAINHYNLMSLERIKNMPVADLAEDNAHCWLWVTQSVLLSHGCDVLKAWGFTPRSVFIWVKPRLGLGNYLRGCAEYCLFSTRGKLPVQYKAQPNWGFFPIQEHSHKPEEFTKIVERVSPGPYLELFARRRQPGWSIWGDDKSITSDIDIHGYPVPNLRREAK